MSDIGLTSYTDIPAKRPVTRPGAATRRRTLVVGVTLAAAFAGALATGAPAATHAMNAAGFDLTRLLRAMAAMKAVAAAALFWTVLWRLALPASAPRLAAYALACAAMAAGPGLIWSMAHIKLGALFLHAGLLVTVVMLWRDPAMGVRLGKVIERRRQALRASGGREE